jgi:hypothetical protein
MTYEAETMTVNLNELEKAKNALGAALAAPYSDITRDASIQRFEFCMELAWKVLKKKWEQVLLLPKWLFARLHSKVL